MKKLLILTVLTGVLAACQQNSYKIVGTAEGYADGDTLYLRKGLNTLQMVDTIVVKDGQFNTEGIADSTYFCELLFQDTQNSLLTFFIEPGTINVSLSKTEGESRVSGTNVNDEWQMLMDTINASDLKMRQIIGMMGGEEASEQQQTVIMQELQQLYIEISQAYIATAEKNIDNELGYFIVMNFLGNDFTTDKRLELLEKMPEKMKQRHEYKELLEETNRIISIEKQRNSQTVLPAYELPTSYDKTINILEEVGKNKVTILDFWASWCGPCRHEMPFMKQLYEKYQPEGLGIIGISLDEEASDWLDAIRQMGLTWPQTLGTEAEITQFFQVEAIPYTVVVLADGTILQTGLRGADLEKYVEERLR